MDNKANRKKICVDIEYSGVITHYTGNLMEYELTDEKIKDALKRGLPGSREELDSLIVDEVA